MNQSRLPQVNGRIYSPSLHHPVTIRRDKWGVPHIAAADRHDLFFAQGFVHAQDRLWQMEVNRRAANGTLSALLGPMTLDTDRLSRALGFARLAEQSWQALDETTRADVLAYTAGVNAQRQTSPSLPLEFALLRHHPAPWRPLDTIAYGRLQMWALTNGSMGEMVTAQLTETVGAALAAELLPDPPPENPVTLPQGIEVNWRGTAVSPFMGKGSGDGGGRGSNAWVISGEHTTTGQPILANDMHLPVGTPSLWYFVHLSSDDGWQVAGFSQPGLPYVLVGRNAHIAWGATLAYTDCEDLFVEQFHPDDPTRYRFGADWRDAQIIPETIEVRTQKPHTLAVTLTHHGPILPFTTTASPLALASTALRAEAPLDGFARLNQARDWAEFSTAVARIHAPSLNLLYADDQGNIGYWVTGRVPVRGQGDGRSPAPGHNPAYDWIGEIPPADMPHALNPAAGFIVSANHQIVAEADYPHYLGRIWRDGYRARRLEQLIRGEGSGKQPARWESDKNPRSSAFIRVPISPADCRRFQMDVLCLPGLEVAARLAHLQPQSPDAALALDLLRGWDGRLPPQSIGGAVYEVFLVQLAQAILQPRLGPDFMHRVLGLGPHPILIPVTEFQGYWPATAVRLLTNPASGWLPAGPARDALLENCLAQTTAVLRQTLGPQPQDWQWGRLHQITFAHALGRVPLLARLFNQGPRAIGGDATTIAQASYRPDAPYDNNAIGVSSRLVVAFGAAAAAWAMLAPGQSGQPGSPHYGDLITPWLSGDYLEIAWTVEEGTAVSPHTLTLTPPPSH
ncbi:MAG: penicillin acylase family protein [Chloroflexi bacterium]|nr:penicillin acylase family protein [Chloroflexota bacterium]